MLESEEQLAFEAVEAGDYERAKQLLRPLVRQGSTYARDLIGWLWEPEERLAAEAVAAGDYERAQELLIPLARNGSVHALHLLGCMHESGKMANSSRASAISYYRRAADGGITNAFYDAGILLLENGDIKEAKRVFEQGVALGSTQAMYGLGRCLAQGETDHERQEAVRLFEVAAADGHIPSKRQLLGISARKSLFDRIMFIPRLLRLMISGVMLYSKDKTSKKLY